MREIVSPLSGPFTTFGQTPIDFYKVGAYRPELAYSFFDEYYRKGRQPVNFLQAINHTATSNATMTGDYGPELVTNGDFSNGSTGWTVTGSDSTHYVTFANGTARYVSDTTSPALTLSQAVLEAGKTYEITVSCIEHLGGGLKVDGTTGSTLFAQSVGVSKGIFTSSGGSLNIYRFAADTDVTIDNISVREVPKIQWRPHNLLTYSEDFSNAAWLKGNSSVSSTTPPSYLSDAFTLTRTAAGGYLRPNSSYSVSAGQTYTLGVFAKNKSGSLDWGFYDITNTTQYDYTFPETTSEWAYYSQTFTVPSGCSSIYIYVAKNMTDGSSVDVSGTHLYRSDLGGMADVPADARVIPTATTYVRTAGRVIGSELASSTAQSGAITQTTSSDGAPWWTAEGTGQWSISGDVLTRPAGGTWESLRRDLGMEINKTYRLTFDLVANAGSVSVYKDFGTVILAASQTGSYEVDFTPVNATNGGKIQFSSASLDGTISNISVREIDVDPSAARYLPRRGHHVYNGSQWVNKGLLHESEARTNLVTYSEDCSQSPVNVTFTDNVTTSPSGTVTADRMTGNGTSNSHYQYFNNTAAGTHTQSIYVKYVDTQWVQLAHTSSTNEYANFDIQNGVLGSRGTAVTASTIESVGGGWYRISATHTAATSALWSVVLVTSGTDTWLASSTLSTSVDLWGWQIEAASTPSSYIPTSGSTVTRAAESLTIPAANLPWPSPVYVTNTELVTNGTFDTDISGWSAHNFAALAFSSGQISVDSNGSFVGNAYQSFTTVVGRTYVLQADVTANAGNSAILAAGTTQGSGGDIVSETVLAGTSATPILTFVATSTTTFVRLGRTSAASGAPALFDNVSVKEINPLALSIQMSGEMTYADDGAGDTVYFFRYPTGSTTDYIDIRCDTSGTSTGRITSRQVYNSTSYQVLSASGTYSPGINIPFNISSRHGSTFVNGAVDGVALTANTTPVELPDLSSADLKLCHDFMGTIDTFRVWAEDIGDTGIAEATEPSEDATLFLSFDGTETSYVNFDWSE